MRLRSACGPTFLVGLSSHKPTTKAAPRCAWAKAPSSPLLRGWGDLEVHLAVEEAVLVAEEEEGGRAHRGQEQPRGAGVGGQVEDQRGRVGLARLERLTERRAGLAESGERLLA